MPERTGAERLRVFVDADVLFAGAASPSEHSASQVILRISELTLIDAVATEQVIVEAERNLGTYLPDALPALRMLISRCLRIVPDPTTEQVMAHAGRAEPKDLPLLVSALIEHCPLLTTFNLRDYRPGHPEVDVLRPGELLHRVREHLIQIPRM